MKKTKVEDLTLVFKPSFFKRVLNWFKLPVARDSVYLNIYEKK